MVHDRLVYHACRTPPTWIVFWNDGPREESVVTGVHALNPAAEPTGQCILRLEPVPAIIPSDLVYMLVSHLPAIT